MKVEDFVAETKKHISTVQWYILLFSLALGKRAKLHDGSKLQPPEAEIFREMTPRLKGLTYDSPEYKQCLSAMHTALAHHYCENRHHPEHFTDSVTGMNLLDLVEMFCDWKAATLRHADGDIISSIEKNQERFGYSNDVRQIFLNTVDEFKELP